MNKEQVYDEKISPLMGNIIDICKANGIAMIVNFSIPTEEDGDLGVLTNLPDGEGVFPDEHAAAARAIRPSRPSPMMITTTHADGSKTMTAVV